VRTSDLSQARVKINNQYLSIRLPVTHQRRAGRKEIILPRGQGAGPGSTGRNAPMTLALARAHRWQRLLEEGRYRSLSELARDEQMDVSYLCRKLRLAHLAPDIIAAILSGDEPSGLSLEALMAAPESWDEQRRGLGFREGEPWIPMLGETVVEASQAVENPMLEG